MSPKFPSMESLDTSFDMQCAAFSPISSGLTKENKQQKEDIDVKSDGVRRSDCPFDDSASLLSERKPKHWMQFDLARVSYDLDDLLRSPDLGARNAKPAGMSESQDAVVLRAF